jgi:hypothetical protein
VECDNRFDTEIREECDNRFDTEIREECDNRFAIFHCHWKSMDSWVGTINTQHYGTTAKTG